MLNERISGGKKCACTIKVTGKLYYSQLVFAHFSGFPLRTAQSSVKMTIISKSYPVFDHQVYKAMVPENSWQGTSVMSLEATSPTGQKLIYSIIEGDRYGEFSVDFNIGEYCY